MRVSFGFSYLSCGIDGYHVFFGQLTWANGSSGTFFGIHLRGGGSYEAYACRCDDFTAALPPPPPHSPQEQPAAISSTANAAANASANTTGTSTVVIAARNFLPALPPCKPVGLRVSQVSSLPQAQLSPSLAAASITTAQPISAGDESTTQASQPVQGPSGGSTAVNIAAMSNVVAQKDDVPAPTRRASVSSGGEPGAAAATVAVPTTPDESGSSSGTNAGAGSGTVTTTGNGSHVNQVGMERRHRALPVAELSASCVVLVLGGRQDAHRMRIRRGRPTPAATRATGSTATGQVSSSAAVSSTAVVTSASSASA